MKSRQTRFDDKSFEHEDRIGGSLSTRRRFRGVRPFSTKQSMHLVMKSSLAKGAFSLRSGNKARRIDEVIRRACAKYGVKLIRHSNNFNHLHLHLKFASRTLFKRFVRSVSAQIAMIATDACKTRPMTSLIGRKNFWDRRFFSRVVRGWRGFKTANDDVKLNQLEADAIIPKRESRLRGLTRDEWECSRRFRS